MVFMYIDKTKRIVDFTNWSIEGDVIFKLNDPPSLNDPRELFLQKVLSRHPSKRKVMPFGFLYGYLINEEGFEYKGRNKFSGENPESKLGRTIKIGFPYKRNPEFYLKLERCHVSGMPKIKIEADINKIINLDKLNKSLSEEMARLYIH